MHLSQHKLCTRKMERALEVKLYLDFHWVTCPWWKMLTSRSDVEYVFPWCCASLSNQQTDVLMILLSADITVAHISLFSPLNATGDTRRFGLVFDPRSKAMITNNMPGVLQFYMPQMDHHVYTVRPVPLSILRVINVKFLLQAHQKYYTTQYEELGFS